MLKAAVLSTFSFLYRNCSVLNFIEDVMHALHEGHLPISFASSSCDQPCTRGVRGCCCGECGRLQHHSCNHEHCVPISTYVLPFCTQCVKSELWLASMPEVQTVTSDKPTYNIQDVDGSPLKSVLQSRSGGKHEGQRGPLGGDANCSHSGCRKTKRQ